MLFIHLVLDEVGMMNLRNSPHPTQSPPPIPASSKKQTWTVMQLIPNLGAGGAEQTTIDMVQALVQAGHRAIVVSHGGHREREIEKHGGTHIKLPVHSKNPLTIWLNSLRLKHLIRKYKVNIVHARSRAPAWSAYLACQATSAHFITTCHAPFNIGNDWKRRYNSSIILAERVIANSHFVAEYLRSQYQIDNSIIRIIPRGIPIEWFDPNKVIAERMHKMAQDWRVPDGGRIVLLPGRLTRWKGQSVLIEAMSLVKDKNTYCILLGDDQGRKEYRQELELQINALNLNTRVRVLDHVNDMAVAYMLADIVISASIEPEGFGRVVVEAQAMGRPVIATDIGGSRETIIPNQTGWLIPPDDPPMLAKAIDFVLSLTDEDRYNLAMTAIPHVRENFSKDRMTRLTLAVYQEVMSKRKG